MANPAAEIRAKVKAKYPDAEIFERKEKSLKHAIPSIPGRYVLDCSIGPLHYGSDFSQEIDTAWQAGTAPWDYEMVKAGYNAYALADFSYGQIVKYVDPESGQSIAFQPLQLQYTNDLDQIQAIADPQSILASVDDDTLYWAGAYGSDIDLRWQTQTARLDKRLIIQNLAALPEVEQYIIDGGNPVLKLEFIFQKSNDLEIWINDIKWDEKPNNPVETSGHVEFRQISTQKTTWHFAIPISNESFGSDNEEYEQTEIIGLFRLYRQGPYLYVQHRIPLDRLQSAIYPVEIDTTVDRTLGDTTDDAFEDTSGELSDSPMTADNANEWYGWRWTNVTVPNSASIIAAYVSVGPYTALTDEPLHDFDFEDSDDPPTFNFENSYDVSSRTRTGNAILWDNEDLGADGSTYFDTPSLVTPCQAVVNRGGWASGQAMVVTCHQPNTSPTRDLACHQYPSGLGGKLHIEYGEAPAGQPTLVRTFGIPTGPGSRNRPGGWN